MSKKTETLIVAIFKTVAAVLIGAGCIMSIFSK
jgi:hypothetical protein